MNEHRDRSASMLGVLVVAAAVAMGGGVRFAWGDIAVVAIDRKVERVDGKVVPAKGARPDSVMVLDLKAHPPRVVGEVDAPTTVGGPPITVAVSPDESLAVVTGGLKINNSGKGGPLTPDNRITVIDLESTPPRASQHIESGPGPSGVSFTPDGSLVLVANRAGNSVSVFSVAGKSLTKLTDVVLSKEAKAGPSGIAITPDGKTALVTMDKVHGVAVLSIDGNRVTKRDRLLTTSLRPYPISASPAGDLAAVGNMGRGKGDLETISLIDVTSTPVRVINTITVGMQPESVAFSADGKLLAVVTQNGSQNKPGSTFYHDHGLLTIYRVSGHDLEAVDQTKIDSWPQGIVFSRDGSRVYTQSMMGKRVQIFGLSDGKLSDTGQSVDLGGGGAAIRTAY